MRFAAGGRLLRAESVRGTGTALRAETVRLRERRVLRFAAGGGFSGWRGCAGRGLRCAWEQFGCGCDGVRFAAGEGFSRWRGRRRSRDGDCVARRNGSVAGAMGVHFAAGGVFSGGECARRRSRDGDCVARGNGSVAGAMGVRFVAGEFSPGGERGTGAALRAGIVRLRGRRACVLLRGSFFRVVSAERIDGDCVARRNGSVARAAGVAFRCGGRFLRAERVRGSGAQVPGGLWLCVGRLRAWERRARFRRRRIFLRTGKMREAEGKYRFGMKASGHAARRRHESVSSRGRLRPVLSAWGNATGIAQAPGVRSPRRRRLGASP